MIGMGLYLLPGMMELHFDWIISFTLNGSILYLDWLNEWYCSQVVKKRGDMAVDCVVVSIWHCLGGGWSFIHWLVFDLIILIDSGLSVFCLLSSVFYLFLFIITMVIIVMMVKTLMIVLVFYSLFPYISFSSFSFIDIELHLTPVWYHKHCKQIIVTINIQIDITNTKSKPSITMNILMRLNVRVSTTISYPTLTIVLYCIAHLTRPLSPHCMSALHGSDQSTWSVTAADPSCAYVTRRRRRSLGGRDCYRGC